MLKVFNYESKYFERGRKFDIVDIKHNFPTKSSLKLGCVGICGTDVSIYRGIYKAKENVILGHEYVVL